MTDKLQVLLQELEAFGANNDAVTTERPLRMLNITPDTGEFLSVLAHSTNAKRILKIGTSNGYLILWLAQAAQAFGGHVTTVEPWEFKFNLATTISRMETSPVAPYR